MGKEIYTFLSFNTTGLDHKEDQVIEISAVRTDLERIYGKFYTTVKLKRDKELPDEIKKSTVLQEEELINGMEEMDAFSALYRFMKGTTLVIHYAPFELSFLSKHFIHPRHFICTRYMAKVYDPKCNPDLVELCAKYGIDITGEYKLAWEIEACIELFKLMKPWFDENNKPYLNIVAEFEDRKLRYIPAFSKTVNL